MVINSTFWLLMISLLTVVGLIYIAQSQKNKVKLTNYFLEFLYLLILPFIGLGLQVLFSNTHANPIYFDYITYIFTNFGFIKLLIFAIKFNNINADINKFKYLYLISIINTLILWTNEFHGLFYKNYSVDFSENVYGIFFYINTIFSYLILIISIVTLLSSAIKKTGIFSAQTILFMLGLLIPLGGNFMAVTGVLDANIYLTPILFIFLALFFMIAIIKYKALNIIPIASRTIMDTISDAYILISSDGTIVDKNIMFDKTFKKLYDFTIEEDFFKEIEENKILGFDMLKNDIKKAKENKDFEKEYMINITGDRKYFDVDIRYIYTNDKFHIATLILFRDITEHKKDIEIIKSKQEILVKQGQLASIGELAGGVAHDINTPISAIKTGLGMLESMYDVRDENEKQLLYRMNNCTDKIITIVNSMRNQIRNLDSSEKVKFKIKDVINDVKIIAYNALTKNKCDLEINILDDITIYGNKTKFGQVITNLVINAMQAYDGVHGKIIIVVKALQNENTALVEVMDFAGGIPDSIRSSIFKNILTTKGVNGTGLGLYLAYSVIKGEFDGEISFESVKGEGTTFKIVIPGFTMEKSLE